MYYIIHCNNLLILFDIKKTAYKVYIFGLEEQSVHIVLCTQNIIQRTVINV
jgi:hypothetical protein